MEPIKSLYNTLSKDPSFKSIFATEADFREEVARDPKGMYEGIKKANKSFGEIFENSDEFIKEYKITPLTSSSKPSQQSPKSAPKTTLKLNESILEKSPKELYQESLKTPLTERTLAENKADEGVYETTRKEVADDIIAKYDKDREQISYSLYNEGVDKKKAKESINPPTQMPQDVLKTPDLGKTKFVKDWTDKRLADELDVWDALTLTPKETYRVTKGAHAIDVDDKLTELTDQNKWKVITELQKSYAGFIKGYSDSFINADNTKEEEELVRQAVDVAIKKADASGEIIKKNIETKYLNNYTNILTTKLNERYDGLKETLSSDELDAINKESEYVEAVNAGKVKRDPAYEQTLDIAKEKIAQTGYYTISDTLDKYKQELDNLPVEYKKAAIAEKAQKDLQNYRDTISRKKGDLANGFLSFSDAFDSAVERNLLKGLPNSVMSGLASVGVDFGEAWVAAESVQPGILNQTTTKNLRPSFEKSAVYHDTKTGIPYEIGFSENNQVSEIYDKNGYVAVLSDEEKLRIGEDVEKSQLYKKAKTNINGESLAYKGVNTALDVAATIALGASVSKALNAVKLGGGAGALSKLGSTGTYIENQLLQAIPMAAQYWGNATVDAIRSGELSPQEASWYGAATTAMEIAIEGINPLMGRVSKGMGRISQVMESVERRNILALLGKYTTKQARARAFTTFLKDMASEQGEEILSLYTTPALNVAANQLLEGNFDTSAPTAEEWYETMAITAMATIIPATFSGINDFSYLTSDKFFKESLYAAADVKYKESISMHLTNLEKDGTITNEERTKFEGLVSNLSTKKKALDNIGGKSTKASSLREDIMGLYAQVYGLETTKANDEELDEKSQEKINKAKNSISKNIEILKTLDKNIPSERAAEDSSDNVATNTDNNGKIIEDRGEAILDLPNFSQTQKGGNLNETLDTTEKSTVTTPRKSISLYNLYEDNKLDGAKVTTEDGSEGRLSINEGGAVELITNSGGTITELGNIEDVFDKDLSDFKLTPTDELALGGFSFKVDGDVYVSRYPDPTDAIDYDENGNVASVTLEKVEKIGGYGGVRSIEREDGTITKVGETNYARTKITGKKAERIAIDLHLEKLEKNEENEAFDQWLEQSGKNLVSESTGEPTTVTTEGVSETENISTTGDITTDGTTVTPDGGADVTTDTVDQTDIVDENLQEKGVATKNNPLGIKTEGLTREQILATIKSILKKDKILLYQDEDGNPCTPKVVAKKGLRDTQFNRGGKWSVVEDLKGSEFKTHEQGGVDLQITSKGVAFKGDGGYVKASRGLVIPKK